MGGLGRLAPLFEGWTAGDGWPGAHPGFSDRRRAASAGAWASDQATDIVITVLVLTLCQGMAQLTIQQTFDLALRHHRAGCLQQAEPLYREILGRQGNHADTHMLIPGVPA